jgi:hypothetical protein
MIILTADEANKVRGQTVPGAALAPTPLADGTFALPEAVLSSPAHQVHHTYLRGLPTVPDESIRPGEPSDPNDPSSPIINSDYETDPAIVAKYMYESSWPPGELIVID